MSIYHRINCFFLFSFLGYLLECAVLSYENKRPVFNRDLDTDRSVLYMDSDLWERRCYSALLLTVRYVCISPLW